MLDFICRKLDKYLSVISYHVGDNALYLWTPRTNDMSTTSTSFTLHAISMVPLLEGHIDCNLRVHSMADVVDNVGAQ